MVNKIFTIIGRVIWTAFGIMGIGLIALMGSYLVNNYKQNVDYYQVRFEDQHMTGGTYVTDGNIGGVTYRYYGWFGNNDEMKVSTLDLLFD